MKLEEFKKWADGQKNKCIDDDFKSFLDKNQIKYAGDEWIEFSSDDYYIDIALEDCVLSCQFHFEEDNNKHKHVFSYYIETDVDLCLELFPRMIQLHYRAIKNTNDMYSLILNYKYGTKLIKND